MKVCRFSSHIFAIILVCYVLFPSYAKASITISDIRWNYHGTIANTINVGNMAQVGFSASTTGLLDGSLVVFTVVENDIFYDDDVGNVVGVVKDNQVTGSWVTAASCDGIFSEIGNEEFKLEAHSIYSPSGVDLGSVAGLYESQNIISVTDHYTPPLYLTNRTPQIGASKDLFGDYKTTTESALMRDITYSNWAGGVLETS